MAALHFVDIQPAERGNEVTERLLPVFPHGAGGHPVGGDAPGAELLEEPGDPLGDREGTAPLLAAAEDVGLSDANLHQFPGGKLPDVLQRNFADPGQRSQTLPAFGVRIPQHERLRPGRPLCRKAPGGGRHGSAWFRWLQSDSMRELMRELRY